MYRCVLTASLAVGLLTPWSALQAQGAVRSFPATALRGSFEVTQPPEVLVNGQPARLAPGARIRSAQNMLLMSGALVGDKLLVNYTRDTLGNVHLVWVLTAEEAARKPWPSTAEQAQAWRFNPAEQTWSTR